MKKAIKSALYVTAALAVSGATIAPVAVSAWGDSDGGRRSYTIEEINSGVLGDKIVLNSISNSVIGDEKNFVGARLDNGDNGAKNVWNGNEITAEDGKDYIVRLYVHNNNPKGTDAVAKGVTTTFVVPTTSGTSVEINGLIETTNAAPSTYWDNVIFKSKDGSNFHLEYYGGSALLENNGIGKNGGIALSDKIVTEGVKIGYDALDGNVPGCYQYANYVTIKVKAVYDTSYTVEKQVRKVGEKDWKESVDANIGDEVEFQIVYKNTSNNTETGVTVKDVLPKGLEYVKGTTKLYNAGYPSGLTAEDKLTTSGLNIGSYTAGSNAIIRFSAKVVEDSLKCGENTLTNWGQVSVNGNKVLQDSASVKTSKTCSTPDEPEEPTDEPSETPESLPSTGATTIVSGILGAGALTTTAGYYLASRKSLKRF
ncbi:DUF11 domain-containing protein [Candidatus Saccharibacteria bacterium]|nr:DUF11 domain-containing protein [Candidatus Saccharibacteria bacterium]